MKPYKVVLIFIMFNQTLFGQNIKNDSIVFDTNSKTSIYLWINDIYFIQINNRLSVTTVFLPQLERSGMDFKIIDLFIKRDTLFFNQEYNLYNQIMDLNLDSVFECIKTANIEDIRDGDSFTLQIDTSKICIPNLYQQDSTNKAIIKLQRINDLINSYCKPEDLFCKYFKTLKSGYYRYKNDRIIQIPFYKSIPCTK